MTEKSTILCEAVFNEDKTHRYAWKRVWDSKKPELCIITLNPNSSNVFELDLTSMLVTNNAYRLKEYGGVNIVNLFFNQHKNYYTSNQVDSNILLTFITLTLSIPNSL